MYNGRMQISRDFTIAVHTLLCIEYFKNDYKVTSDFIAGSVGVNPVIIRRMLLRLKNASLVEVKAGTGGASLLIPPEKISLYDVYKAAGCDEKELFNFHENPNSKCPVGGHIHNALDFRLELLTQTLEDKLKTMKLSDVMKDLEK